MRVLSGARVDRWRASSGQTPSSVTRTGVETAAACEAKARVGKGQRFRYRTPSLSTVPRISSRVRTRVRCRVQGTVSRQDAMNRGAGSSPVHRHAPAGTRWSGQWSESVTGMRAQENQMFSLV
jgi:hypothetical protein